MPSRLSDRDEGTNSCRIDEGHADLGTLSLKIFGCEEQLCLTANILMRKVVIVKFAGWPFQFLYISGYRPNVIPCSLSWIAGDRLAIGKPCLPRSKATIREVADREYEELFGVHPCRVDKPRMAQMPSIPKVGIRSQ